MAKRSKKLASCDKIYTLDTLEKLGHYSLYKKYCYSPDSAQGEQPTFGSILVVKLQNVIKQNESVDDTNLLLKLLDIFIIRIYISQKFV